MGWGSTGFPTSLNLATNVFRVQYQGRDALLQQSVVALFFLIFYLVNFNSLAFGISVEVDYSNASNISGGCDYSDQNYNLQPKWWQKNRDSCAYNLWFSAADESIIVADQLARPLIKLQGYGFHEDVALSVGCAWCSRVSAPIVASGGWDGALMFWNASTGAFLFKRTFSYGMITALSGHQTGVPPPSVILMATWKGSVLAISPCDNYGPIETSSSDNGMKPALLWVAAVSSTPLHSVCLCGDMGYAGSNDGIASSVRLLDGKILNQIRVSSEALWSMACTPGPENRMVTVSGKQEVDFLLMQ
jgi:hypothetical protein